MSFKYDFAISYAGEEKEIAYSIYNAITEKYGGYSIFFGPEYSSSLVGQNGEEIFEKIFYNSTQVIVVLSENYKKKEWTRYEWDIIKERNKENRCIPIKIDNVKILGFPSNQIYLSFDGDYEKISKLCVEKLISFEKEQWIKRLTEVEVLHEKIENSIGTVDKLVQLVYDARSRSPLGKIQYPLGNFKKSFEIIHEEDSNFSRIKQKIIGINLKDGLSKNEVRFNIKYLTAEIFNSNELDAIKILVFCNLSNNYLGLKKYNVAKADFAPYGEWGRAEEGFVYNLPIEKFDWKIEFEESYFDKTVKMESFDEMALRLIQELNRDKK